MLSKKEKEVGGRGAWVCVCVWGGGGGGGARGVTQNVGSAIYSVDSSYLKQC